jgi:hypothetical protein
MTRRDAFGQTTFRPARARPAADRSESMSETVTPARIASEKPHVHF